MIRYQMYLWFDDTLRVTNISWSNKLETNVSIGNYLRQLVNKNASD